LKKIAAPWNRSLVARITGVMFLLALLAVILVSYLVYTQATKALTQSVFDRLHAVSILKEDDLNRWVDQQRFYLVFLAWQPDVRQQAGGLLGVSTSNPVAQKAYAALLDYLRFVVTSVSDSNELFIMDLNGNVVLSTQPAHEGQSHAQDLFFSQGQSATYVEPVYISPETGRPTITVATPLFDRDKRRVGVLASHLNLSRVDRLMLERTGLGASGETYLVDPTYEFVSASQPSSSQPSPDGIRSSGIEAALQGKDGQALYSNYQGVPVVGAYNWMNGLGAALMVEISQKEAFAPARQLALQTALIGFLASLLLGGVAYLLARQVTRPVLAITETARKVAGGDLTQVAPVMSADELGLLASTFNQMTEQLRLLYQDLEKKVVERTAELVQVNDRLKEEILVREQVQTSLRSQKKYLEALHETSLGLISRLDLQELFEDLVTRAGQLMGTSHGFIFIVEPGENEIECKVGVGLFTRLVGFRLPSGEGLGGTIWQTGQPLIVNDYDHWAGRAKNIELGLISSIIGVPLTSGNQVVGALGLAFDSQVSNELTFEEDQVELLNRFAHLASIALDNARLYTAAKDARRQAEAANEAKSAFLANVSHELRTPLTSIHGFAHILKKRFHELIFPNITLKDAKVERAASQVDEHLGIILGEAERLTVIINDLLDLEKIQAGKMTWHMVPLQMPDVIHLAAKATAPLFENKGLAWVEEIPQDIPLVNGDRDRLEQVVINLISNAVKFSDSGQITCRIRLEDGEIIVSIQDQGIGISPAYHALVFEKFGQVENTLAGKPKGTGLGLPICKEIIAHHGGRMWLESAPGQGSTFYFSLPLNSQPPADNAAWNI
jgi:signal transduction histidine kinase/HAMP domain-containing protein